MARKKKKTKVKNNKQRAQRQQKKQQRRSKRSGDYTPANRESTKDEIVADALALFPPTSNSADPDPAVVMEYLFFKAADTGHLISEPEFDDVGFEPLLTSELFAEAGEKRGFDDDMEAQSEEEQYDTFIDVLDDILDDLLADGVREEILDAVDSLRIRLKKSKRRREDVARLAALQMVLSSEEPDEPDSAWPAMGLVQAMVQRSLGVGLEIMEVLDELPDDPKSVEELLTDPNSPLKSDGPFQKIVKRVENSPLLKRFMHNQFDDIWDEGVDALFNAQLVLNIFTEDEQNEAADIFHGAQLKAYSQMGFERELTVDSELDDETERELRLFMSTMDRSKVMDLASKIFIPELTDFAEDTFSIDERRDELLVQLERLSAEHLATKSKWGAFLVQAYDFLDDEPDEFVDSDFLLPALMGEIKPLVLVGSKDDELSEDDSGAEVIDSVNAAAS